MTDAGTPDAGTPDAGATEATLLFQATIVPHRSLTRRGWLWVIGIFAGFGLLGVVQFAERGLWPVILWIGLEAVLAAILLRLHLRSGRACEVILIERSRVRVLRTDPRGRRSERSLPVGWLNPVLEETPGRVPRLLLVTHGVQEEIGTVLGEQPKRALAESLRDALRAMREPRFDNPQLRD
jgi:uncharacterized membrane protein